MPPAQTPSERRKFTADYKRRILHEAETCEPGQIGALLRREGLYSSHLVRWRAERARGELAGLAPRTRGRKPDPAAAEQVEIARLKRENERLHKELEQARALIDLQKKLADLLTVTTTSSTSELSA
jgi:transposase-like protein